MPASTFTGLRGLRFRGIPDSLAAAHLEASECCLIHADNHIASRARGVFVNPAVRVGYNRAAYDSVHPFGAAVPPTGNEEASEKRRSSGSGGSWVSLQQIYFGLWKNRLARWLMTPWFEEREVRGKIERWAKQEAGREEKGGFCVVDEMQIVVNNGWKHL